LFFWGGVQWNDVCKRYMWRNMIQIGNGWCSMHSEILGTSVPVNRVWHIWIISVFLFTPSWRKPHLWPKQVLTTEQ